MYDTRSSETRIETRIDTTTRRSSLSVKDDPRMDTPLRKHAAIIHINGDLGLLQRKLFNVLLLNCLDDLDRKDWFELPIDTLTMLLNFKSKNIKYLDEAARQLRSAEITFNLLNDRGFEAPVPRGAGDGTPRGFTGLISSWVEDGRIRRYEISRLLARQLKNPKVFASINLRIQSKFTSAYALNLYENCARFRDVKSTGFWDLELLRKLLGATDEAYDDFRKLRVRAIEKAIEEINERSDIEIKPDYKSMTVDKRRRVTAVRFLIKDRAPQLMVPAVHEAVVHSAAFKELRDLGVSPLLASQVIADEGEQRALEIVTYTRQRMASGKVKSPGAYASRLIKDRAELAPAAPPELSALSDDKVRIERDQRIELEHRQKRREKLRRQYENERRNAALSSLSAAETDQYLEEFIAQTIANRPHLMRCIDEQTRTLTGIAKITFEIFVVKEVLGDYTDAQFDEWIARRMGSTGDLFPA